MSRRARNVSVFLALSAIAGCGGQSKRTPLSECEELSRRFARTLTEAKRCEPSLPVDACSTKTGSDLSCGPPTWVVDDTALRQVLDDWWNEGCAMEETCPEYGDKPQRGECSKERECVDRND